MFLTLTSADNRNFKLNARYVSEIIESSGEDVDINAVLFSVIPNVNEKGVTTGYKVWEVQETLQEIEEQMNGKS
jgi:hypothetical protein